MSLGPNSAALEGLGFAAYLAMDFDEAIDLWQQSYAAYRADGNGLGAVRVACMLGYLYGIVVGDWAIGSGWIARAQHLLGLAPNSSERGWVALTLGMFERDRSVKHRRFDEALEVASATGDNDLAFAALAYLGASLVHTDEVEEGMVRLDESLAAVAGGEVGDLFVIEEIFCQMFSACERAHDVVRSEQWLSVGEAVAAQRNLPAVIAYCHTHFGGVMTAAGRWPEAEAALTDAIRLWALGRRTLRPARLPAWRISGYGRAGSRGLSSCSPTCHLRRSAPDHLPCCYWHRARSNVRARFWSAVWPNLTQAARAQFRCSLSLLRSTWQPALENAEEAVAALEACAAHHDAPYLTAALASARGRLAAASGEPAARACFRVAIDEFAAAQLPLESARSQLAPAKVLADELPDVAKADARAALAVSYGSRRPGTSMPQPRCCARWDCGSRRVARPGDRH